MPDTLETNLSTPETPTEQKIAALGPWFHNLHLPDGAQTAPHHQLGDFPAFKWQRMAPHVPDDLTNWRALDIGCNAGYYSFELAKRGADVTAIDVNERYLEQAQWAAEQYDLENITFRQMQVYDLAREDQTYDLILFLGVFYHLRYPLLALDIVAEKTQRLLAFQTLTIPGDEPSPDLRDRHIDDRAAFTAPGWPKMAFIEDRFAGDPTNWWAPNHTAVEAMLRSSGLRVTGRPEDEMYLCEPQAAKDASGEKVYKPFFRSQQRAATGVEGAY